MQNYFVFEFLNGIGTEALRVAEGAANGHQPCTTWGLSTEPS
jgi:hypothetical protein